MSTFRAVSCLLVLTLGLFSYVPNVALAATLTSRSLLMSRQQASVATNMEFRFTTPTGVESSTDTITITFPSDFDPSSVVFGDIDLFHGATTGLETSETLAATAAAGVWGASVTGLVLTLTAPSDAAAGEITAGDKVVVRIGTNATGGINQVLNPSSTGSYTIAVAGTFGDTGTYEVAIISTDLISVSATVPSTSTTSTPPGGGPSGGTDGTAPAIFNVQVINITTSTAQVVWQTDEAADSRADYGVTTAYGLGPVTDGAFVTSHSLFLTGLSPETMYHLRVTSRDIVNNSGSSPDITFQTSALPQAPIISNIQVVNITDSGAVILWDTNIPANSVVEYGTTLAYGEVASLTAFVTNHAVQLVGLTTNTLYHFRVLSTEPSGLSAMSGDGTFTTTGDVTAPSNVFGFQAAPGDQQVVLTWTNPTDPDFSFVRIFAKTGGYPTGPDDGRLVYQGGLQGVTDTGLTNGVHYYYANYAYDGSGNHSSGAFADAIPFGEEEPLPEEEEPEPPLPPGPPTTTEPIPPTTTTTEPLPPIELPEVMVIGLRGLFFGADGTVELEQDSRGTFGAVVGTPVQVRVPIVGLEASPVSGVISVGDAEYALVPLLSGDAWGATFVPSNRVETLPVTVTMRFADGREQTLRYDVIVQGYGRVLEIDEEREQIGSDQASVSLYALRNGQAVLWNGASFGQRNPVLTDAQGRYVFLVPNGRYRIRVEKSGFLPVERDVNVRLNVIAEQIALYLVPVTPTDVALSILQTEEVQDVANITAPVVAVVALGNLVAAANLFSLFHYFWFLLTQPILLLGKRKRKSWGIVYNALSKRPVDLAIVRLIHAQKNLILQTRITDAEGRYFFTVKPGTYRIEVARSGFTYPSSYLAKDREDGEFLDVYHGEVISVKEEATIGVNIPLDPAQQEATPRQVFLKKILRHAQHAFSLISLVLTAFVLAISPSWLMFGMLLFQIFTYLLFRRLAMPKKPKSWGIVYDKQSKKPIGQAIVRIFDAKFGKVLETQITDDRGRYGFVVGKNVYFMTVDGRGYETLKTSELDMRQSQESVVHESLALSRATVEKQK